MADRGVDPISLIQMAVEKLDSKLDKTNDKVDELTEIVSKQALLFERLANFEINSKESINRIHERIDEHSERIKQVENYMLNGGCPAHKSFLASKDLQDKKWHETADSISNRVNNIDKRLKEVEDAPVKIVKTISNRVLMVFGTALGGAILYFIFGVRQ